MKGAFANAGEDRDIFLAKIGLNGTPTAIYTYPGDTGPATSYPRDVHSSVDGQFVAMAGYTPRAAASAITRDGLYLRPGGQRN